MLRDLFCKSTALYALFQLFDVEYRINRKNISIIFIVYNNNYSTWHRKRKVSFFSCSQGTLPGTLLVISKKLTMRASIMEITSIPEQAHLPLLFLSLIPLNLAGFRLTRNNSLLNYFNMLSRNALRGVLLFYVGKRR